MQDGLRRYTILCGAMLVFAITITLYTHYYITYGEIFWSDVLWFSGLTIAAELLSVRIDVDKGIVISPSIPLFCAVACVLGPLSGIVVVVISGIFSMTTRCSSFYLLRAIQASGISADKTSNTGSFRSSIMKTLSSIAATWQSMSFGGTIAYAAFYLSNVIINVGLGGIVYKLLGGHFLLQESCSSILFDFILPFFALVIVSNAADICVYVLFSVVLDPIPGTSGIYGFILRSKIALVETAIPLGRPQLFLVVVAMMLAYLYAHIRMWAFVISAAPVVALKDFFCQWIEEREAYVNTITTLATYMQHYHPYTRGHLKRVADMSERLARELRLPAESIRHISTAGFLHDIGKIGVSEEILDKTEKLTDDEWEKIKEHPVKGAEIISHLEFLECIVDWIKYHHKWYDGKGYPQVDISTSDIPIEAGIIAVADAFDAMTDDRDLTINWKCDSCGYLPNDDERPEKCPVCGAEKRRTYREPKSLDEAMEELRRGAGSQFDPKVVKAFFTMVAREGIKLNG